jgi:hypothetical protein
MQMSCGSGINKYYLLSLQVAVKTLKAELFHNQTDLEDFVKEGVLLSTLSHPYAALQI